MEIEPSVTVEVEPILEILEVEEQLSPDIKTEPSSGAEAQLSHDVKKIEPSPGVEAQPSTDVKMESTLTVKTEPSPKPNEKIFGRIAKSVRGCFCLNKSHHNHDFPPLPPLEFRWLQCHQHWMFEGRFNFKMVF
jgi:hypothetical protein